MSLSAGNISADSVLFAAYQHEDMQVWKQYLDTNVDLIYEYGYCGYIVDKDKEAAKPFVHNFRNHVESQKKTLPPGHYQMYMSAVLVFELRLHESVHPVKAMSLAKEATQLAPNDPLVLSYYGTSLFYAPKPFGSKSEALKWFERAQKYFRHPKWKYCWIKEANEMYIRQCKEKIGAAK
ncbi:MAG: hypothetical protein IKS76_03820 [Paludibacteraceae bacterium]|nr:hypothetical protein [Paludibacteraceae bacterium]MBR6493565.1 hypothetical protein [Paludibacteraceae bacterium]